MNTGMNIRAALLTAVAVIGVVRVAALAAQATNPPYLSEMPPVERVLRETQGADADETAARRMGTFLQFKKMIEGMAGGRFFRNQLTPDETRLIALYHGAYWDIAKTKPEYQKFTGLKGYDVDPAFRDELFRRYFSPAFRAHYDGVEADYARRREARAKADTANMMRARAEAAAYEREQAGKGKDVRALARCVASGRSESQCLSEGLVKGFNDLVGGALPVLKKAPITGLRISGAYAGQGRVGVTFWDEHAVVACGDLVADERAYTLELKNGQVVISVKTSPKAFELVQGASKPFILTVGPDGSLIGPGPTEISGRVQVGIQEGTRTWSDGRVEPISRPVYENRTVRCNIGALALRGASPPMGTVSTGLAVGLNLMFGGGQDTAAGKPAPPGLRLSGEYGGQSAMDLEFHPEGVVVGCGDAVVARDYKVRVQGGQVQVSIQHGASPFTVTYRPDGALMGSGAVQVTGKVIVGTDANNELVWASKSGTCSLDLLAPAAKD